MVIVVGLFNKALKPCWARGLGIEAKVARGLGIRAIGPPNEMLATKIPYLRNR